MSKPPVPHSHQRAWFPLGISGTAHLLLLALAAGLTRRPAAPDAAELPADEARHIDMIYVPPPETQVPVRAVPPAPLPPALPLRRTAPEPEPNAPPEAIRSTGIESAQENRPGGAEPPAKVPISESAQPAEGDKATLESEARRIFGRLRPGTRGGAGPQATRPMEAWVADRPERCIPSPAESRDSAGPAQLGIVVGRIFRQDNGRPLVGAHLQMLGTPYVTFTDGNGEYRFRFDRALVDNCRAQYVRVSASGYESRLLVLVVGPNAHSEDVRLRRR